jgi:hypothetical protein
LGGIKLCIIYTWDSDDGSIFKLLFVIPRSHRELVLKQLHDWKSEAHLGVKKTLHKVRVRYFWFALRIGVGNVMYVIVAEVHCEHQRLHSKHIM